MKYTHVIWDFNGTVLDDMQAGIDAINAMLLSRGLSPVAGVDAYREIFTFPVEEYYRLVGFDFEKEDFKTVLAPEWVARYNANSKKAPLFGGVASLTAAIRAGGMHQSILSASDTDMMLGQLRERGALSFFDEVWGTDSIHAYGKQSVAAKWLLAHKDARAVLLGDTLHDFEVAREMGVDCILVAAGHQSKARLLSAGVSVVNSLADVAPLLGLSRN